MFIILRCRNGVTTIKDWYGVSKCVENSTFADLYNDFIGGTFDKKPSLKADFPNIVHAFVGKNKTELSIYLSIYLSLDTADLSRECYRQVIARRIVSIR